MGAMSKVDLYELNLELRDEVGALLRKIVAAYDGKELPFAIRVQIDLVTGPEEVSVDILSFDLAPVQLH